MRVKTLLLIALSVPLLLLALVKGIFFVDSLNTAGHWPFKPLDTYSTVIRLKNGSEITVVSTEDRDFTARGINYRAYYTPLGSAKSEEITTWYGLDPYLSTWVSGELVVAVPPGNKTLMVRTVRKCWKGISFEFPAANEAVDYPARVAWTSMSAMDYKILRARLGGKDFARARIDSFDAGTRILKISVGSKSAELQLADDGDRITLK